MKLIVKNYQNMDEKLTKMRKIRGEQFETRKKNYKIIKNWVKII